MNSFKNTTEYDKVIKGAIALTESWIVENQESPVSTEEIEIWKNEYFKTNLTAEREGILKKLAAVSLPMAQDFALKRPNFRLHFLNLQC